MKLVRRIIALFKKPTVQTLEQEAKELMNFNGFMIGGKGE
jgi:hypothetical protein